MLQLILAILCSVTVGVLIKYARQKGIRIDQSIAVNYIVTTTMTFLLLKPDFQGQSITEIMATNPSAYIFVILSITLPTIFLVQAKALEFAGIIRTDAAQRLSLFLPILAAFTIFGEQVTNNKLIALLLAFVALGCLLWKGNQGMEKGGKIAIISLALVWIGYGVNDILFKQIAKSGSAFPVTLAIAFIGAGCFMFIYLLLKRTQWHVPSVLTGLLLGVLNFGNILFYIQAHQAMKDDPTLVFTGMNLGVICLGTFVGAFFFKEKIHRVNYLGVAIAIVAIICLFYWR
ncbi:EamA/RhaT family transporter [Mannheimia bovis]|uniref:EamA/RhaT family transporter n=1 Tax=Mannheimia bovis TaxID=2770636 RepID=A0A7H1C1L4_9PAST|nr:EamA/RhaT family transporter [Mannheimia bovis]QNS14869.1 EamA/RhaT family transporter [Mannheimia bovis]